VLYSEDGLYSHIEIFENLHNNDQGIIRFLKRDNNFSSAIFLDSDEPVFLYSQFITYYADLVPNTKRFLMLGGGAYTIPTAMHKFDKEMIIDVVETEPSLFTLAHQYFKLPVTDKITNFEQDARIFVNQTEYTYDFIFIDVFSTGLFVPSHLITKEFFEEVARILNPNGAIVLNFIGTPEIEAEKSIVGHFTKTVSAVFPSVEIYLTTPKNMNQPQNLLYVLRNSPSFNTFSPDAVIKNNFTSPQETYQLSELLITPSDLYSEYDKIITDNNNPAETLIVKERVIQ
jgi:spermidine synthase